MLQVAQSSSRYVADCDDVLPSGSTSAESSPSFVGGGGGVVGGGGQKVDHQSPCEVTDSCNPLL